MAVLSARLGPEEVRKYVERCYIEHTATLDEKLAYARYHRPAPPPYPAEFARVRGARYEGRITCGDNPHLYARLVKDLRVEVDDAGNEELRWTELPVPKPAA